MGLLVLLPVTTRVGYCNFECASLFLKLDFGDGTVMWLVHVELDVGLLPS